MSKTGAEGWGFTIGGVGGGGEMGGGGGCHRGIHFSIIWHMFRLSKLIS